MSGETRSWQDIRDESPDYVGFDQPSGYPDPVPTPDHLRRGAGAPPAPGSPHDTAVRIFLGHIEDDDARLVHGTILVNGERRPHAWVEVPENLVWDGGTRRFYNCATWSERLHPASDRRYTRSEAARLLLTTSDSGPWDASAA